MDLLTTEDENPFDYFVNRAVTVLTRPTAVKLNNVQQTDYFSGVLRSVDQWTLTLVHPVTKCRTLFRIDEIIGIAEEQILDPSNPEDRAILDAQEAHRQEFLKANPALGERPAPTPPPIPPVRVREQETPFIDFDALKEVARMSQPRKS